MNESIASTLTYANMHHILHQLMTEAIYPQDIRGTCLFELKDDKRDISFSLTITADDQLVLAENVANAKTVVRMNPMVLFAMLLNLDNVDLRSTVLLNEIKAEGNLKLVEFLFSLIKRPSEVVLHYFSDISKRSIGQIESVSSIQRIFRPSPQVVIEHLREGVPIIATDSLRHWRFLRMELEQIKDVFGDIMLPPIVDDAIVREVTLSEFIGRMQKHTGNKVYTEGCELPAALKAKFSFPFFNDSVFSPPQLWLGTKSGKQPCTRLHRDCTHNFLGQLIGRKRIVFYSPDQSDYLYPQTAFNTYQPCHVTHGDRVDIHKFPLFRHAKPLEVLLEPGELMIIPAFWFHCVYALETVMSVSSPMLWDGFEYYFSQN